MTSCVAYYTFMTSFVANWKCLRLAILLTRRIGFWLETLKATFLFHSNRTSLVHGSQPFVSSAAAVPISTSNRSSLVHWSQPFVSSAADVPISTSNRTSRSTERLARCRTFRPAAVRLVPQDVSKKTMKLSTAPPPSSLQNHALGWWYIPGCSFELKS